MLIHVPQFEPCRSWAHFLLTEHDLKTPVRATAPDDMIRALAHGWRCRIAPHHLAAGERLEKAVSLDPKCWSKTVAKPRGKCRQVVAHESLDLVLGKASRARGAQKGVISAQTPQPHTGGSAVGCLPVLLLLSFDLPVLALPVTLGRAASNASQARPPSRAAECYIYFKVSHTKRSHCPASTVAAARGPAAARCLFPALTFAPRDSQRRHMH